MENLKSRIDDILSERNLTRIDLANLAGVHRNVIAKLNYASISLSTAIKIANFLNISIDYMVGLSEDDSKFKPTNNNINFYNNCKKILEELNISQRKLCRDLNFSTDAFTRWKNGQLPFLSSIISIAKYLNVEIEELIGRK